MALHVKLSGDQIRSIIAERKEREKLVRLEAQAGSQPPPLLAMAAAEHTLRNVGKPGYPTQEEIDAEIARSRARRAARVPPAGDGE